MADVITKVTAAGISDNRLQVINKGYARKMEIGSSWTSIRIAARFSIRTDTPPITIPFLYFGLSAGTSSIPGTASPAHFLGMGLAQGIVLNASDSSSLYRADASANTRHLAQWKSGVKSETIGTGAGLYPMLPKGGFARGMWMMEITKGSPNFAVKGYMWINTNSEMTRSVFNDMLQNGSAGTISGNLVTRAWVGDVTPSVDEATDGYLDSLCIAWGHETIALDLADMAFKDLS